MSTFCCILVWLGNLDKVQSDTWLVWAWYQVMLANGDWTSHGTSKLSRCVEQV